MLLIPKNQAYYPITPLFSVINNMKDTNNFQKFYPRYTLWSLSEPYFTHSLDVNNTTLNSNPFALLSCGV